MKDKQLFILILGIVTASILLFFVGAVFFVFLGDLNENYDVYKTYGNVTVATTTHEVRIDDANDRRTILVHNVSLYGQFGDDLYIIDKDNKEMILDINSMDIKRVSSDDELSEQNKKNFDAVASLDYENFSY